MGKYLQGIVCANITPFDKNREVDYKSIKTLSKYLVEIGLDAVYPMGTNGEGITLTIEERKKIAETMVSEISGQIPVVIQCGTATTETTVELVHHAKKIGADAAGILTPFFFKQSQEALVEYYCNVAKTEPDFPLYIYNIPSHTSNDVLPNTVKEIRRRCPNIVGIKYSHPDLVRLSEYMAIDNGFDALIGCDNLIWPACALGAVGTVSGPAAVFPDLFHKLWSCCKSGDVQGAKKLQKIVKTNDEALAKYQSIPLLKLYLQYKGVISDAACRIPFRTVEKAEQTEILDTLEKVI